MYTHPNINTQPYTHVYTYLKLFFLNYSFIYAIKMRINNKHKNETHLYNFTI